MNSIEIGFLIGIISMIPVIYFIWSVHLDD